MRLSGREMEASRIAQRVDGSVDFRAQSAFAAYPYAGGRLALISIFEDRSRRSGSMIVSTY
jgi:hypothetical protein